MTWFQVIFSPKAEQDLLRLYEHRLERATTVEGLFHAQEAIDAVRSAAVGQLARSPFLFRKADRDPFFRELVIPFGSSGYVAFYEIQPAENRVVILAVRHQREEDFH